MRNRYRPDGTRLSTEIPTKLPFQLDKHNLVRPIGRLRLIELMVNFTIVAGIFGLPSVAARLLGCPSPVAYFNAAVGVGVIGACFAEAA